ncbi:MAG: RNA methyltransferase [Heliobacteriaceae bacterium]|jgi:TrmH family RNA methyltransferase|nr:RNA methyltransferase [Heliobacteriaceae bacterium]
MEITSVNNELVKETAKLQQSKYRESTGKFLLEGWKAINEAIQAGIEIETIFIKSPLPAAFPLARGAIVTTEAVLKKISTTDTPPEAVAVGVQRKYSVDVLKNAQKVILLENIKDPGNLGTILRTAAAFGVDAVALYGDSVDLYNPKVVRASVGNLWKIPVVSTNDLQIFADFERIATLPKAKNSLKNIHLSPPWLLMFGSEADGLSKELIDFATEEIKIEMSENVESLNLAASCAVILYKTFV